MLLEEQDGGREMREVFESEDVLPGGDCPPQARIVPRSFSAKLRSQTQHQTELAKQPKPLQRHSAVPSSRFLVQRDHPQ